MDMKIEEISKLKPGRYIMMDGRPCEIKSMDWSAPGKHGHAKYRVSGIDIVTGSKKQDIYTSHDKVEVPVIEKMTAQVLSASGENAQLLDMSTFETFDVKVPEEFRGKVEPNMEVVYWDIMGEKIIKQIKGSQ